ncbi:MAG: recombinase [Proteobacteria bacterium]|nr:recombinase [Pseudomonadota bacterium]
MKPARVTGVDWVVGGANPEAPLVVRLSWLESTVRWIQAPRRGDAAGNPETRVRFLLQLLERNPQTREAFARTLARTLGDLSSVGLLCEIGLPRAHAFFQEFGRRLAEKFLPAPPANSELATVFTRMFPRAGDATWIADLSPAMRHAIVDLFNEGDVDGAAARSQVRDVEDSLLVLASDAQAIGLSWRVRERLAVGRPRELPFAELAHAVYAWMDAPAASTERLAARGRLEGSIAECRAALADAMGHLAQHGVSLDLVYTLERARLVLKRMQRLLALSAPTSTRDGTIARFIAQLADAHAGQQSVRLLLRENMRLLARRVVESTGRTGEHYLTTDAREYGAMLWSAAIGGAVTGFTVLIKLAITGHGSPLAVEGLEASLNYALSFVAIHLLHGTLATKQPATTAATLAARLAGAHTRRRLHGFVSAVASLVRSQIAAIAGNLVVVVPVALALQWLLLAAGAGHLPDADHAQHYVESFSLKGATPIYAALTGVLLWVSALIAGWFENWASYRRLPAALARAPWLVERLGESRAKRFAAGIERNVPALGGNISLGFLLGMVPEVAQFFGIPFEVRHVTLATGQLALACYTLGSSVFATSAFWWAVAGIAMTGFLNLTVSFCLAMWVAIRSTAAGIVSQRRLFRAVLVRVLRRPGEFILPPRAASTAP